MDDLDLKETEEVAQIIIDTAVNRIGDMGFGVVADGTVYGNSILLNRLRVIPSRPVLRQPKEGCA